MKDELYCSDCLDILKNIPDDSIDLIYIDPPFYTQKAQKLGTRDRSKQFCFSDVWKSSDDYTQFINKRLVEFHRVIAKSGSIFFHCDRNASHIARFLLDDVFGPEMFRAEIIWYYHRWSNSQRNLIPAHQNIFFYSKTDDYTFNEILQDYSLTTNIDQILQKRERDESGKAVYARDINGETIFNGHKKGVPISDVWEIPYLNPKARERVGYPTQKPILLLERIIKLTTDMGDIVLDPFCGSGTTLIAAKILGRKYIGIDISSDAIEIAKRRLDNPIKSKSNLLELGKEAYENTNKFALSQLSGIDIIPVQRNKGIDAFLKLEYKNGPVPIRVQRPNETLLDAANYLFDASKTKRASAMVLVATKKELNPNLGFFIPNEIIIIDSTLKTINEIISQLKNNEFPNIEPSVEQNYPIIKPQPKIL